MSVTIARNLSGAACALIVAATATFADGLPDGWSVAGGDGGPRFDGGGAVFEPGAAGPIRRGLDPEAVREARVRFRLGEPPLVGFGVGVIHGDTHYNANVRKDGMFGWSAPTPHYAGPRWSGGVEYEIRYLFDDTGFHVEFVGPDGIPRTTGHLQRYRAELGEGWRSGPLWLTVGGAAKAAEGSARLLDVLVLNEGDPAPEAAEPDASTVESSLAKYRRVRDGGTTPAIDEAVASLEATARPAGDPPRFEVQAWDAQKLGALLATDEGTRRLAEVYTLLQMRNPPDAAVARRMREHGLGFSLYVNTRQPRYEEALAGSPHVVTDVPMKGEVRRRVNVFSGDWIELSTIGTLHEIREAVGDAPLRRVLLDSEYATGVGDDPLSRAALEADDPGTPLVGYDLPAEAFSRVHDPSEPAWRAALWRNRWGTPNVGHRAIAAAVDELWPGVEVTTDPIDDHADLEQFRGLDVVQHWIRVHWAPRHPRSVAYYTERGRAHVRNSQSLRGVVIGPQLGRNENPTPPDMLGEACWMAVAFGARGITHWGQQAVFTDDGGFVPGGEAAWDRLVRLRREVYGPLADLMLGWDPTPRRVAVLVSRGDAIAAAGRRFTHDEANENVYRALLSTGEPADVVYDAEVLAGALDRYRVLVVPSLYVADAGVVEAIRSFAGGGGTVIAHRGSVLDGLPNLRVLDEDLAPRYRDYWITKGEPTLLPHEYAAFLHRLADRLRAAMPFDPAVQLDSPHVVANLLQDDGGRYLALVNDARAYGEEAEELGARYMLDRGERVTVRVGVEGVSRFVDVVTGEALPVEDGRAVVEIEPGWGRVIRLEP